MFDFFVRVAQYCLPQLLMACVGCEAIDDEDDIDLSPLTESAFVTLWKTNYLGYSDDNQIQVDTIGNGYDYQIVWGDGRSDKNVTGSITHTYATPSTYSVEITRDFPRFYLSDVINGNYRLDVFDNFTAASNAVQIAELEFLESVNGGIEPGIENSCHDVGNEESNRFYKS